MKITNNQPLAEFTSFGVGGSAEHYLKVTNSKQLVEALRSLPDQQPLWRLGWGTNSLISDHGLPGTTLHIQGGQIEQQATTLIAEAGVYWDDLVTYAVSQKLWGLELMSGIPGGVGAATHINISAYGQSLAKSVAWVEVFDLTTKNVLKVEPDANSWAYKQSIFQDKPWLILRVALELSRQATTELVYQAALDEAEQLKLNPDKLDDRRQIILAARAKVGALLKADSAKTAGSFFRNPLISPKLAEQVIKFDESGRTVAQIKAMNKVHGGQVLRVSAAHVLLAAGFKRAQRWGQVGLHKDNLLKIENLGGAKAQEIYQVAQTIKQTVSHKLGIELEEEVELLGKFD